MSTAQSSNNISWQFENRINIIYSSISKLSCDIKFMYRANTGHKFILTVTDDITNYLLAVPLYRGTFHEIGEALINNLQLQVKFRHIIYKNIHMYMSFSGPALDGLHSLTLFFGRLPKSW